MGFFNVKETWSSLMTAAPGIFFFTRENHFISTVFSIQPHNDKPTFNPHANIFLTKTFLSVHIVSL